jgi:putative polyhydroxyalkanoate system protein
MASIHIQRDHTLGLAKARKIAFQWAEQVENEYDMQCSYEEGDEQDCVTFERSGVKGQLWVSAHAFDMQAELGFLLGAFKGRIEQEIVSNLDALLDQKPTRKTPTAKGK